MLVRGPNVMKGYLGRPEGTAKVIHDGWYRRRNGSERLIVLHTLDKELLQACLDRLDQAGLPNLWIPRPQTFFKVDAIPYLGTGKLDLRKIRELAAGLADRP